MSLFPKIFKNYFLKEEQKSLPTAAILPKQAVEARESQTSRGQKGESEPPCLPRNDAVTRTQPFHPKGKSRAHRR